MKSLIVKLYWLNCGTLKIKKHIARQEIHSSIPLEYCVVDAKNTRLQYAFIHEKMKN